MKYIILLLLFICSTSHAQQLVGTREYTVQRGENIGQILYKLNLSPLWGRQGYVQKTIELNSHLLNKDGNIVLSNVVIKIPVIENNIQEEKQVIIPHQKRESSSVTTGSDDILNSLISLTTGLQFWQIDATEKSNKTHAKIESEISPSIDLRSNFLWDNKSETYIGIGYNKISFKQPETRKIQNLSENYGEFYLGQKFHLSPDWTISGEFKNIQRPFLRATSNSQLTIDSPWMQQLNLGLERKLITKKNGFLALKFSPYYLFEKKLDDYTIKPGAGFRADIKLKQDFKKFSMETSFFVDYASQDSSLTNQKTQYNGILVRFNFPLGGN